jgi:AcrR family transcriptional regulator
MGQKGDAKRQQILDTAKDMLLKGGIEGFVLRDVAERLGITHGNLQYYFRTRQDLLVAIFDQELAKYADSLQDAVAATTTRRGRLGAIIDAGLKELRSPDTALWRMVMSMADHSPDMAALLKKENDLYRAVVARELKQIAPQLSTQRRKQIARIIQAILDGLGIQFVNEDPDSAEMRALESEIKAAIFALVDAE